MLKVVTFGKQTEFVDCPAPFVALISGVGGGKTRAGAIKALDFIQNNPGALGIVTAPTYKMLAAATIRTYMEVFGDLVEDYHKVEQSFKVRGGEILFRSTEDPETLRGPNLAFFHMDEPAQSPHMAFLVLQGRLRQAGMKHQGWVTGTPQGYNWLYQEFVAQSRPDYAMFNYSARDNPFLPQEFIARLESSYQDPAFALQEIEGQFTVVGGDTLFQLEVLRRMLLDCRPPLQERGMWRIWKLPVVGRHYVAGLDTATGEAKDGGSQSASAVVDCQTGEVVAALWGSLTPDLLGAMVVPVWREYDAFGCVERMGPAGQWAIHKIKELGYNNLYYEDGEKREKPGLTMSSGNRGSLLVALEEAVRNHEVLPYCRELVDEMFTFVRGKDGQYRAAEGARDDLVLALALAWRMRFEKRASWGLLTSSPQRMSRMVVDSGRR